MGRRKSSTAGSEVGSDTSSLEAPGSRTSGGRKGRRGGGDPDFEEDLLEVDPFEVAVEQLYEKRATTRESALSTIVSLLSQFRYDDCAFREDTLTQLFLSSVRRGKEVEACLAAKALGLHVATLGASSASEAIYQEAERVLEPLILTGKSSAMRAAGAEALAVLCFVGSEGTAETLHTMATLWRVVLGGEQGLGPPAAAVLRRAHLHCAVCRSAHCRWLAGWLADCSASYSASSALTSAPHQCLSLPQLSLPLSPPLPSFPFPPRPPGWKKAAVAPAVLSALRSWAFLLSTVPASRLDAHFVETHLGLLAQLLNGSDVDVRSAAGEAIALLWEMADLNSLPDSPRVSGPQRNGGRRHNTLAALAVGSPPKRAAAGLEAEEEAEEEAGEEAEDEEAEADCNGAAANGSAITAAAEAQAEAASPAAAPVSETVAAAGTAEQQPPPAQGANEAAAAEAPLSPTMGRPPLPPRVQVPRRQRASAADVAEQGGPEEWYEDDESVDSLEAIVERMRDLAKNRGDQSRLNKGDRASSRGTFRDLLAIIQGEFTPETKIKLRHGDLLMVTGLLDNIRLNFLRAYLAEAFQSHMQSNELLHEVFQFQPADEPEERLTPLEKRLFRSKSSNDVRDRTELRRKERATMSTYKYGGLADFA